LLAYQAADAIKRGRLKIVLASFEQPAAADPHRLSRHSRVASRPKVRTLIDLAVEISGLAIG